VATVAGLAITIAMMASQAGLSAAFGVTNAHPEQYTLLYDMASFAKRQNRDVLPRSVLPPKRFPTLIAEYNVDSADAFDYGGDPAFHVPLTPRQYKDLRSSWGRQVLAKPIDYLAIRTRLFLRQIAITRSSNWVFHPQLDANTFGYRTKFPKLDKIGSDYAKAFAHPNMDGTLMQATWIYLLLAFAGAVVLLRRRFVPTLVVIGGLALTAFTLQIGFYFGAMGTGYRFEQSAVVVGLISLAVLAKLGVDRLRARRGVATHS
jgi:hypothetical protein